jgi:hypothetical protein
VRCADCGVKVERSPNGHWAERKQGFGLIVWSVSCRKVQEETDDGYRLVSADYHYVQGETQRHWPEPTTERRQDSGNYR